MKTKFISSAIFFILFFGFLFVWYNGGRQIFVEYKQVTGEIEYILIEPHRRYFQVDRDDDYKLIVSLKNNDNKFNFFKFTIEEAVEMKRKLVAINGKITFTYTINGSFNHKYKLLEKVEAGSVITYKR